MYILGILVCAACLMSECLSVNPALSPTSPQASQASPTNIGSSTSNSSNPSLLLSLVNAYSPSSASSSSPSTSQTGSSTQETRNQSSPSIPLPSNQISSTQSSTVPAFTNLLSPNSMTQTALREWALLTSNRHAPFNMALAGLPPKDRTYEVLQTMLLLKTANLLDCTSVGEVVGGDEMAYLPMNCRGMCPWGTTCVMVKSIGFCCPRRANNGRGPGLPGGTGRK